MSLKYLRFLLVGPVIVVVGLLLLNFNSLIPAESGAAAAEASTINWRAWVAIGGGTALTLWGLIDFARSLRGNKANAETGNERE